LSSSQCRRRFSVGMSNYISLLTTRHF